MGFDLKSLFNLDSDRFGLNPGAGAFRRVTEKSKSLSIGDLLRGLVAPTIPDNLPTVNPIDDSVVDYMKQFMPAQSTRTSLVNQLVKAGIPKASAEYRLDTNYTPPNWQNYSDTTALYQANRAYDPYRSTYNSLYPQYSANQSKVDTYNQEVTEYKNVVGDLNQEVTAFKTEAEKRFQDANTGLINPDRVNKQAQQSTGDVLAESDLYSDDLHNMMIDRISTQPIIDKMSAMFSGSGGGSK